LRTDEATAVNYARLYYDKRGPLSGLEWTGRMQNSKQHAKFLFDFHDYTEKKLKYALKKEQEHDKKKRKKFLRPKKPFELFRIKKKTRS